MKRLFLAGFTAAILGFGTVTFAGPGNAATEPAQAAGQIMVKFRDYSGAAGVLRQHGLSDGPDIGGTGARLIKVPAGKELQLVEALSRNPAVEYAEPDHTVTTSTTDEYFPPQYTLQNNGQAFTNTRGDISIAAGTPDADVDAVEAFDYPAMSDTSLPATAAMIRAMRAADQARTAGDPAEYKLAVDRFSQALQAAEKGAGVP